MNQNLVIDIFLLVLLLSSCERQDDNYCHQMGRDSGYLPIQTISEISHDSVDIWLTVDDTVFYWGKSVFLQIDEQETFDKLVNCNRDDVEINFKNYTLLIGYFHISYTKYEISEHRVYLNCGYFDQSCVHRVFVNYDTSEVSLTPVHYNAFIPKLPDGLRVSHHTDNPRIKTLTN
jgi:hypothetical protein